MNPIVPISCILVADDNPTDVFFLERRLRLAGVQNPLAHVGDGLDALRWLDRAFGSLSEDGAPWLVFLDLRMPRMDGFELLLHIRQRGWLDRLVAAVLTTSDEPVDIRRAADLGAHRFLVKYPSPSELAEVVTLARDRSGPKVTRDGH